MLCWGNGILVPVNISVDVNRSLWCSLTDSENCDRRYPIDHRFNTCKKSKILWYFNIKNKYNEIIIIGQWTIENNVPFSVLYQENKNRTILITHCHNFGCRTTIIINLLCIVFQLINSTLTGYLVVVITACT